MTMLAQIAASGGGGPAAYIEDVFSTYLYTGTGATQTITNGIDLAGKGGLVWFKARSFGNGPALIDTARGGTQVLATDSTNGQSNFSPQGISAFNADGFTFGTTTTNLNATGTTYASWTFRKQPKFFDVVTYTGDGVAGRQIAHSLGSVPGCIIFKRTDSGSNTNWRVYHRSLGATKTLKLNTTDAEQVFSDVLNDTSPTSTVFTVGSFGDVNANGGTYVAYLFAHDAGGFGLSGNENVVSCGSYVGNDSTDGPTINLGYEPQWVMIKNTTTGGAGNDWLMADNMRGIPMSGNTLLLSANLSSAETGGSQGHALELNPTGFKVTSPYGALNSSSNTYIYIAIRRGPMKVPTLGTTVYNAIARTGTGAAATVTGVGFTPDWLFTKSRSNVTGSMVADRLRGEPYLQTNTTGAETTNTAIIDSTAFSTTMDGFRLSGSSTLNNFSPYTYINYLFKRAPSFFDEVCYTGTGSLRTVAHNLTVVPELMIVKNRASAGNWSVWDKTIFAANPANILRLQSDYFADPDNSYFNSTAPTASVFTVNTENNVNMSGAGIVAYLFATCAGVSKVGSYTGTGATQAINCGFTAGARFVLIKRTDNLGDWYYWDSTRGIVAGNDPYLLMNTTAAEVTGTDYVDTSATGFELSSTAPAAINASGGSYIFLAVA